MNASFFLTFVLKKEKKTLLVIKNKTNDASDNPIYSNHPSKVIRGDANNMIK